MPCRPIEEKGERKAYRSTGIEKIDDEYANNEQLSLEMRHFDRRLQIEHDFLKYDIGHEKNDHSVEVNVVGAGWDFVLYATALVAAGAKVVAYEMDKEKISRGQIGLTYLEDTFDIGDLKKVVYMTPRFTSAQLQRLPSLMTEISNLPGYKKLLKKFDRSMELLELRANSKISAETRASEYEAVRISKLEVIELKDTILQLLKDKGVLEIKNQEVTFGMVQSWLESNKPVLMATGMPPNLKKLGLDHLDEYEEFLKEFRLHNDKTEGLLLKIGKLQETYRKNKMEKGINPPKIALIGGGPSAATCAKELLDRLTRKGNSQDVEIVCIAPEKRVLEDPKVEFRKGFDYKLIPGYVSDFVLARDQKTISSVKVSSVDGKTTDDIPCDLLIHIHDQVNAHDSKHLPGYEQATESITKSLDEKSPRNGLVRFASVIPRREPGRLMRSITQPWTFTLEDDTALKKEIDNLISRQDQEKVTVVITGFGGVAEMAMALAKSKGYRGRFLQVAVPYFPEDRVIQLEDENSEAKKKVIWKDITGRVIREGSEFENGKFSLGFCNKKGENLQVTELDAVINAAGKDRWTPLLAEMLQNGYLEEKRGQRHCKHPMLATSQNLLQRDPKPGPQTWSVTLYPWYQTRNQSLPWGWEDTFDFARRVLSKQT